MCGRRASLMLGSLGGIEVVLRPPERMKLLDLNRFRHFCLALSVETIPIQKDCPRARQISFFYSN